MLRTCVFSFVNNSFSKVVDLRCVLDECGPYNALVNVVGAVFLDWQITPHQEENLFEEINEVDIRLEIRKRKIYLS